MTGDQLIIYGIIVIAFGTGFTSWVQGLNTQKESDNLKFIIPKIILIALGTWLTFYGQDLNSQKESSDLKDIGRTQLRAAMYTSSLEEPVRDVYIKLSLRANKSFADLCPFLSSFEIMKFSDGKMLDLRFVVSDDKIEFVQGSSKIRLEQFMVKRYFDEASGTQTTSIGKNRAVVNEISIPLLYQGKVGSLIYKLRDFNQGIFKMYLPETLMPEIKSIELVVNGWAIVKSEPNQFFWDTVKLKWDNPPVDNSFKTAYKSDPHGPTPPESAWPLNLYSITPDYVGEWLNITLG